jgi:hypothetical protein
MQGGKLPLLGLERPGQRQVKYERLQALSGRIKNRIMPPVPVVFYPGLENTFTAPRQTAL